MAIRGGNGDPLEWFGFLIDPHSPCRVASLAAWKGAIMSGPLAPIPWFDIVLIVALIALNGVFAMSELAIVSSREARLRAMAKSGSAGATSALALAADPSRFLSTVQIGITLIGILAG